MPRTDLRLMGLNQVGFELQNHQNQCSIQAGIMIRLNWFLPVELAEKNFENLIEFEPRVLRVEMREI